MHIMSQYLKLLFLIFYIEYPLSVTSESGYDAWLRYPLIPESTRSQLQNDIPITVVLLSQTQILQSASNELERGIKGLFGQTLLHRTTNSLAGNETAFALGTIDQFSSNELPINRSQELINDGFIITSQSNKFDISNSSGKSVLISARNDRGVLYGVFALLRKLCLHQSIKDIDWLQNPSAPIRWTNEWNNLDGSIERGYAGKSIYFENDTVVSNLSRASDYARLLASIGINSAVVNNVNANTRIITPSFLPQLKRLSDAFTKWGINIGIAVEFSSPKILGNLSTFDPLDENVIDWWKKKVDEIYAAVPNLSGFVLKADSEGRNGPSAYNRTHADAANVLARALKPHNGIMFYRGFVYDHHADWRNLSLDRARASYDNFIALDGLFDENASIQLKHGPIDFQVREPASPLFGALNRTNIVIEFQVTQEYLGQQRHVCYIAQMWKNVLDFDMKVPINETVATTVKAIVSGKTFKRPIGGYIAVVNVGLDRNWLAHDLAMANLYAFGRLAWNPELSAEQIADEWTRLTFSNTDQLVIDTVNNIQMLSWPTYENYTGMLGIGTLTDIINIHYGPGVESSEHNGWGQWHRSDHYGSGMDRTFATGTKFIGQYWPEVAKLYEPLETCPEELLLFMHHVNYTHRLKSGKTVIQHTYDTHYYGAEQAQQFVKQWTALSGRIDSERYNSVLDKLVYQSGHSYVWRDAVCQWFRNMSQIDDTSNRVGNYVNRTESESMTLNGYQIISIEPFETASHGKAVECVRTTNSCFAQFVFNGTTGWYDVCTQYYDQNNGVSHFKLIINNKTVSEWSADYNLPSAKPDGHTSTRHRDIAVALKTGDSITIDGRAVGEEHAVIDYVEIIQYNH